MVNTKRDPRTNNIAVQCERKNVFVLPLPMYMTDYLCYTRTVDLYVFLRTTFRVKHIRAIGLKDVKVPHRS